MREQATGCQRPVTTAHPLAQYPLSRFNEQPLTGFDLISTTTRPPAAAAEHNQMLVIGQANNSNGLADPR